MTRGSGSVDVLADHSLLLAIPAFLPALAVVAVVVFVAVRDRRAEERDRTPGAPSEHGAEKER
ncbi:hypothetical protein [Nocardia implantans]|uniref:Uncharacterized protein n=1 Tax=Nocardia implantans TaxID=3108168 RepID=A0ABU6B477_9NOCA|nr:MULTISPECIES: hypothetical protein [unclassified Nocardia]MBF6195928.1 hypothetical protein [Nocardia beijingensis]MEA3532337.1 hypothetical protein [Nocardia sp. CDC192]MEB3514268.1 hypothetical protein [Nocardia sp. CDC186]